VTIPNHASIRNGAGAMVRSVNREDGCCGGRHGCARGRRTRWWLARLQVQWRRDDGGAAVKLARSVVARV